ncbi:MAG: hypothetical protein R3F37_19780 [Candidatus Competibacteraceae bacterium]
MPETFYAALWATLQDGKTRTGRILNRRRTADPKVDPELFWAQVTIAPILDAQQALQGYVSVQRDVTDEVHRQQQQLLEQESAEIRAQVAQLLQAQHSLTERLCAVIGCLTRIHGLAARNKVCLLFAAEAAEDIGQRFLTHPDSLWESSPGAGPFAAMYSVFETYAKASETVFSAELSPFLSNPEDRNRYGHYGVLIRHGETALGLLLLLTETHHRATSPG